MKTSDQGIFALMIHEGIVPGPYRDSVGVWTYGIGHTKAAGAPDPAGMARGMPTDLDGALVRVFEVFRKDLERYEREVDAAITVDVSQAQFDAAVSFHYNTGAIRKASWVKALNAGDLAGAHAKIMNWRKPKEIIPRRKAERDLLKNGIYPSGAATVWNVDPSGKVIWQAAKSLTKSEALSLLKGPITHDMPEEQPKGGVLAALLQALAAIFGRK